jgi:hypothetical protein
MKFIDKFIAGQADIDEVDDAIDEWHSGEGVNLELHEYLGLTVREYSRFVMSQDALLDIRRERVGQ